MEAHGVRSVAWKVVNEILGVDINRAASGAPSAATYLRGDWTWSAPSAGGAGAWGTITGALGDQTDLATALAGKSDISHNHAGVYAAVSHGHTISDSTGLQTALDGKAASSHTHAASAISDSTAVGRSLVTAGDAAAARSAIGAGTSDFSGAYSALSGLPTLGAAAAKNVGTGPNDVAAGDHTHAGGGSDPFLAKLRLASDVSTGANVTPVSVTGLVFTFEANSTYLIEVYAITQAPVATTGSGFQLDTSVAVTTIALSFTHQLANTGTVTGGSSIADDASVGVSSGRPTANVNTPVTGGGVLVTGANPGTAQLRYRSEVAAVSTCKAGTVMRVMKIP